MSSIRKLVHFHLVGALGTLVNLGALALAHDVAGAPLYPLLVISFSAAVVVDFLPNRSFTFELASGTVVRDGVGVEPA